MCSVKLLLVAVVISAMGSITSGLHSPCPDLFRYDSTEQAGQWTGTVTLLSDAELHGVWARLIFDEKLTELNAGDLYEVIADSDRRQYLIKNKNVLLKAGEAKTVKITVKYEGDKVPGLITYRLNAQVVCSAKNAEDLFTGDFNNKNFLASLTLKKPAVYKEPESCGTAPLAPISDLKSQKAQNGQWPWQAAIHLNKNNKEHYACEGTLISTRHLLTPAHCVTYLKTGAKVSAQLLTVYFGQNSPNQQSKNGQKLKVAKVILYPGFDSDSLLNDLAVIELEKAVTVNDYVRPICLSRGGGKAEGLLVGYGIKKDHAIDDLAQAKVNILSHDKESSSEVQLDNVLEAKFAEDNGVCVGDSGSGLASLREGQKPVWELRGIVVLGVALQDKYECNQSSTVFLLDVAKYSKWIRAVIS